MITVTIKNKTTNETKEYELRDDAYGMFIGIGGLYYFYTLESGHEAFSSIQLPDGKWEIINNKN